MNNSISRQDTIDALMNDSDWADAIPTIKSLPSSESKTGQWHEDSKGYFYCDQCHKYPKYQEAKTDFCPNCGARMYKGGEHE